MLLLLFLAATAEAAATVLAATVLAATVDAADAVRVAVVLVATAKAAAAAAVLFPAAVRRPPLMCCVHGPGRKNNPMPFCKHVVRGY